MSHFHTFAALTLAGTSLLTLLQNSSARSAAEWIPLAPAKAPVLLAAAPDAKPEAKNADKFFTEQVQPQLKANCMRCHEGVKAKGGLRLDSREAVLKGGDAGPSVDLKNPQNSLLLKAINYGNADLQMPPAGKMTKAQIDLFTKWVEMGLPYPAPTEAAHAPHAAPTVNEETKKWWAFQPVKRPAVPKVKNAKWATNPIDNFVLARVEGAGLQSAPPADKRTLLRRAYYDLIGLPPSPEEMRAFLADKSPNAYEKAVDKLLASPQYGEKWGRHWLDLVRYAESNSFERDDPKPFVWRYRDWVIQALNDDKPYNRFLFEQLAGDELPDADSNTLIATGYYRLGQWDDEPADAEQARYDELDDIVSTTGQVTLGLTVNCARCHDHKIDPIPQKDYYRFLAFFQGTTRYGLRGGDTVTKMSLRPIGAKADVERFSQENEAYKKRIDELNKLIVAIERRVESDFIPVEKEEFRTPAMRPGILRKRVPDKISTEEFDTYLRNTTERDTLVKNPPKGLEQALCITESGREAPKTFVLFRGSPQAPGDEVQPGYLSVLGFPDPQIPAPPGDAKTTGRRTVLAQWITDPKNPLTARVMVNRLWQYHFGRGIVRSSNNFGLQGTPPTHPELLDWLASEFVAKGWSLKAMHKMMMMSSTYRMSSQGNKAALAKDPENDLMWRYDMRRLQAEEVRDSILSVNGSLNLKIGGPSIYPTIPREVLAGQSVPGRNWFTSKPEDQTRRSVYIHVKRSLAVPLLASFDAADTDFTCPQRFSTTQPTQALSMVNSVFINEQAQLLANYLKKYGDTPEQVKAGLWRVTQREPSAAEIARGVKLIESLQKQHGQNADVALRNFCVVLLNLNEFIYLD